MESKIDVTTRRKQLASLETYVKDIDIEVTMILQSLQWDRKHLMEKSSMQLCQYDSNHRVPPDQLEKHENQCFLKSQGYAHEARLLPSPADLDSKTLVKFNSENITEIIDNAWKCQVSFKRGAGCSGTQPLTLDRLQATYTADERRAIHDEVVKRVPSCHDLADWALLRSNDDDKKERKPKSNLEILAELRDMRRRRTKYRVAAKTRNYSDVLRDVINTQMELYTNAQNDATVRGKEEKADSTCQTEDLNRSNDKITSRDPDISNSKRNHNTYKEQDSKVSKNRHIESQHSRHYEEYERRKRRYDNNDRYQSAKVSKTRESYRHLTIQGPNKSNRSNEGRKDSYFDRDTHHDKYGRRKSQPEKDTHDKDKTQNEAYMPVPKYIKIENCDSSDDIRKRCTESEEGVDNKKCVRPIRVKREEKEDSHDENNDDPHNSKRNETESSETSKSYTTTNNTEYDSHKPHYSNTKTGTDKDRKTNYKSDRCRPNSHVFKLGLKSQGVRGKKEMNIREQENDTSYESDDRKSEKIYHEHRKTTDCPSNSNRDKQKYKYYDRSNRNNHHKQQEYGEPLKLETVKSDQTDFAEGSQYNGRVTSNLHRSRSSKDSYHSSDLNYAYNNSRIKYYDRNYDRSQRKGNKRHDEMYHKKY